MRFSRGFVRRAGGLWLAAVMLTFLLPGMALGHAELVTATPADKSTVTEPVAEVSGTYSEAMTPDGSSLVVKDSNGDVVASGTVDPADDTRMVATPATPLGDGTYRVESTSVATDGHIEHTTWTFTVAIPATPEPTPTPTPSASASAAATASPTPVPATPSPSAEPTPAPSADGSTTASGNDVILPIVVALIILGAGAAYLLVRRNRPTDPA